MAFDLSQEKGSLRERYGRGVFGHGCLLARRLVERGVPFVEVTLGGWDTHDNNFEQVAGLSQTLDAGWSTLIEDLRERGLLDSTLLVWMGEFGRTPGINPRNGRDHFPAAWSVVLGGGGIRGGQVCGRTSNDGMSVVDRPVKVPDLFATIFTALGLDPKKQNRSNVDRPIRLADPVAVPMRELLS
jgi:arylsulfatase A-like enzyme